MGRLAKYVCIGSSASDWSMPCQTRTAALPVHIPTAPPQHTRCACVRACVPVCACVRTCVPGVCACVRACVRSGMCAQTNQTGLICVNITQRVNVFQRKGFDGIYPTLSMLILYAIRGVAYDCPCWFYSLFSIADMFHCVGVTQRRNPFSGHRPVNVALSPQTFAWLGLTGCSGSLASVAWELSLEWVSAAVAESTEYDGWPTSRADDGMTTRQISAIFESRRSAFPTGSRTLCSVCRPAVSFQVRARCRNFQRNTAWFVACTQNVWSGNFPRACEYVIRGGYTFCICPRVFCARPIIINMSDAMQLGISNVFTLYLYPISCWPLW